MLAEKIGFMIGFDCLLVADSINCAYIETT